MWLWHAAEESEHRSVAFDLHRALGGDETWRRRWMRIVTVHFLTDLARQTLRNLRHDGELLRWRTWTSGARFLFGRHGALRLTFAPWRAYFRRDFHPSGQGGERGVAWLATHTDAYRPVSSAAPAA
jgi:predicted metal-dependent hydrolase